MRLKKMMSLLLALVMSFALAVPAFAAEPHGGNEGIMPLTQNLITDGSVETSQGYSTRPFTTTPANGKYIRVWFRNNLDKAVEVMLVPVGSTEPVAQATATKDKDGVIVFTIPTPDQPCSYFIMVEDLATGGRISGRLSATQYIVRPADH